MISQVALVYRTFCVLVLVGLRLNVVGGFFSGRHASDDKGWVIVD